MTDDEPTTDDDRDACADTHGEEHPPTGASDGGQPLAESSDVGQPSDGTSTDEQPTVTVGSDGFRPNGADGLRPDGEGGVRPDDSSDPEAISSVENAVRVRDGGFDWRGWLLVAVVVVSFVVVPGIVLLRPLRVVGFRTTYLLLPLLPAVVLGATAVWVAVRSRTGER